MSSVGTIIGLSLKALESVPRKWLYNGEEEHYATAMRRSLSPVTPDRNDTGVPKSVMSTTSERSWRWIF
jgi:hypothetical protein